MFVNEFVDEFDFVVGYGYIFDVVYVVGIGENFVFELFVDVVDEFVWKVEDENGGVFDSVFDVGVGDKVGWKVDVFEVFCVLVFCVDDFG